MNTFRQLAIIILIINFFSSCNGQSNSVQQCDNSYMDAKIMIGKYGKSSDTSFLQKALVCLDTSIKCDATKTESIELKITIYFLLKDYKGGIRFIDSLPLKDFNEAYKKKMFSDMFKADQFNSVGDSVNSKRVVSLLMAVGWMSMIMERGLWIHK